MLKTMKFNMLSHEGGSGDIHGACTWRVCHTP